MLDPDFDIGDTLDRMLNPNFDIGDNLVGVPEMPEDEDGYVLCEDIDEWYGVEPYSDSGQSIPHPHPPTTTGLANPMHPHGDHLNPFSPYYAPPGANTGPAVQQTANSGQQVNVIDPRLLALSPTEPSSSGVQTEDSKSETIDPALLNGRPETPDRGGVSLYDYYVNGIRALPKSGATSSMAGNPTGIFGNPEATQKQAKISNLSLPTGENGRSGGGEGEQQPTTAAYNQVMDKNDFLSSTHQAQPPSYLLPREQVQNGNMKAQDQTQSGVVNHLPINNTGQAVQPPTTETVCQFQDEVPFLNPPPNQASAGEVQANDPKPPQTRFRLPPENNDPRAAGAPYVVPGQQATSKPGKKPAYKNTDRLHDAPSRNLEFPQGNITAAEICAFLPNSLKTRDVALRMGYNGLTGPTLAFMINRFRVMSSEIDTDIITRVMQQIVRPTLGQKWTLKDAEIRDPNSDWDHEDISVTGFQIPGVTNPVVGGTRANAMNRVADPIPFKDLAKLVKDFPEGPDALDLTRCITYHMSHPDEDWLYPTDFERLVSHLGGPLPVTWQNSDKATYIRFETSREVWKMFGKPLRDQIIIANRLRSKIGNAAAARYVPEEMVRMDIMHTIDVVRTQTLDIGRTWLDPQALQPQQRLNNTSGTYHYHLYPGICRAVPAPLLNGPNTKPVNYPPFIAPRTQDPNVFPGKPPYILLPDPNNPGKLVRHDPEPIDGDGRPVPIPTKCYSLGYIEAEHIILFNDPYQFGGFPRTHPPFRPLHALMDPREDDVSDWAENIRWARKFGHTTLTEDPVTLEAISSRRKRTLWVSGEAVRVLGREEMRRREEEGKRREEENAGVEEN